MWMFQQYKYFSLLINIKVPINWNIVSKFSRVFLGTKMAWMKQ